jgi:DNA transposition AAA+ family ATPase
MNKFIKTKQYNQFYEFCNACRRDKYIGLCYGPAGAGKTQSAAHYTMFDKVHESAKHAYTLSNPSLNFSMSRLHAVLYTPSILTSPKIIIQEIKTLQQEFSALKTQSLYPEGVPDNIRLEKNNFAELVIVDEAERLKPVAFELIREMYDAGEATFIFIGMPGLEKMIERFPQLYSRVGFVHQFKNLGKNEVEFIITKYFSKLYKHIEEDNFSDQEAIATIIRMTSGNFRLINKLLKQSWRIMQVNCMTSLTAEILEAARKCLLIGER